MKKETAINILENVLQELEMNANEFAKALGMNRAQGIYDILNTEKRNVGISKNFAGKINSKFPQFNISWLLTGEGEMLKTAIKKPLTDLEMMNDDEYQPILDIRISAGHGIGLGGNEKEIMSWVKIPDFRQCKGIIVFGDSMYDKYYPGDVVFVREISCNASNIENGQPYIIITREDRFIKLVYYEWGSDFVTLVSYNNTLNPDGRRMYPDMNISTSDIVFLYKVVGKLNRNQL